MENLQSGIVLILVTILERNSKPQHQVQVIVKSLTSQPILQTIYLLALIFFTSNPPSIILDSGIGKSLCSSCHHIIYGKINFKVPLPPPHFRTIWDYKNADASSIQGSIENFNWHYAFESKTVNENMVSTSPGKFWKVAKILEKSWKCPGIFLWSNSLKGDISSKHQYFSGFLCMLNLVIALIFI